MTDENAAGAAGAQEVETAEDGAVNAGVVSADGFALIVADFPDLDSARQAYAALEQEADTNDLDIEAALVLSKTEDGKIHVQKSTDHRTRRGLGWGVVGGVIVGVLFPPSILASAAVGGAAGAGIGRLRHRHNRNEIAEDLGQSIDPGHSGLVALVSDPVAVKVAALLNQADHIVQKAIDEQMAEDFRAEAAASESAGADKDTDS